MLLKLLHGDWTLLWLGVREDGADALSGIRPVEALESLGLLYSAMVSSQSMGLTAGWVWLAAVRLVIGCVAGAGWGRLIILALRVFTRPVVAVLRSWQPVSGLSVAPVAPLFPPGCWVSGGTLYIFGELGGPSGKDVFKVSPFCFRQISVTEGSNVCHEAVPCDLSFF